MALGGGTPPGEAKSDIWIMAQICLRLKALVREGRRRVPDPILKLELALQGPGRADAGGARQGDQRLRARRRARSERSRPRSLLQKGKQLASFRRAARRRHDRRGCWIYSGCFTEAGNNMARRDNSDPDETRAPSANWAFSWPANRRILYNRASADLQRQAVGSDPQADLSGTGEVDRLRRARHRADGEAGDVRPFIMNPEGTARLFARGMMRDGPFPEHYEPFECADRQSAVRPKVRGNPVARVFKDDMEQFGDAKEFPYAATSYRLTEHFHFWTKHVQVNAVLQPELFVEIGEELAKEKGIESGGWVRVWSKRGSVKAKAVVTKRIAR